MVVIKETLYGKRPVTILRFIVIDATKFYSNCFKNNELQYYNKIKSTAH